jgi:hypothetical protein
MIQFDKSGQGNSLPEPDGTVDVEKGNAELRFLDAIRNAKVLKLAEGQLVQCSHLDLAGKTVDVNPFPRPARRHSPNAPRTKDEKGELC